MIEFFRRLFAPERSSETAKERLKLVLLSDHLSLAPDVVAALKRDLLEVISRYVEIDPAHADVTFEQRDREVAMLASIPITGMRERERVPAAPPTPSPPAAPTLPVTLANGVPAHADAVVADEPWISAADVESPTELVEASDEEPAPESSVAPVAAPRAEHGDEPLPEPTALPLLRRENTAEPGAAIIGSAAPPARRRKRRRKAATTNVPRVAPTHGTPGFDPA